MEQEPSDKTPPPAAKPQDSALVVWLKLAGLLIGLSAFCAMIFFVSRMIVPHR